MKKNIEEIKKMTPEELGKKVKELTLSLYGERAKSVASSESTHKRLKDIKKEIAVVKTIMNEKIFNQLIAEK